MPEEQINLTPRINIEKEYETLRQELLQGKKYIFERPLIIVTACIAIFNFIDKPLQIFLPSTIILILIFNLWFTVNRLKSITRIVGYIQCVLENNIESIWVGWESYLRYNRKWLKTNSKPDIEKKLNKKMDYDSISDTLVTYTPILGFHIVIVICSLIMGFFLISKDITNETTILGVTTILISCFFFIMAFRYRPSRVSRFLEESRVICGEVQELITEEIKMRINNANLSKSK